MILDIILHVFLCSAICTLIHLFFHKRAHTKHELTEDEIKELRGLLLSWAGRRKAPLTDARPDLSHRG